MSFQIIRFSPKSSIAYLVREEHKFNYENFWMDNLCDFDEIYTAHMGGGNCSEEKEFEIFSNQTPKEKIAEILLKLKESYPNKCIAVNHYKCGDPAIHSHGGAYAIEFLESWPH